VAPGAGPAALTGFDNPLCGILAALRVCPGENPGARGARPQCERRTRNGEPWRTGGRARRRSAVPGGVPDPEMRPAGVWSCDANVERALESAPL